MKISGIYKIQSKTKPCKVYVGSSINTKKRWLGHLYFLRKKEHPNIKLQNHYNKYGESDLDFLVIEPCFPEFLIPREQYYIDKLKPSFNICKEAGNVLGVKHSKETRIKISESHKGKIPWNKGKTGIYSKETRKKIGDAGRGRISPMKGKHHTEETRKKLSEMNKGKPSNWKGKHLSEEMRRNLSEVNKGKHLSEETKLKIGRGNKGKRAGEKHPMWGRRHTEETRRRMSATKKARLKEKMELMFNPN